MNIPSSGWWAFIDEMKVSPHPRDVKMPCHFTDFERGLASKIAARLDENAYRSRNDASRLRNVLQADGVYPAAPGSAP